MAFANTTDSTSAATATIAPPVDEPPSPPVPAAPWSIQVNYEENRGDYSFSWSVSYTLAFDGTDFTVTTRIDLTGSDPGSLPIRWEQGIESTWSRFAFQYGSVLYDIDFDVVFVEDNTGENYDVNVIAGSGRDNMLNWHTIKQGWGDAYQELIAAHEYGHMIGNFDEYSGGATYQKFTTTGTLMSDLTDSVLAYYFAGIEKYAELQTGLDYTVVPRAPDVVAPTVTLFDPADDAGSVAVGRNIVLTFDETVRRGSGTLLLKTAAGALVESFDAATSARLSIYGGVLTVDPSSNLAPGTTYRLEIPAGSVLDLAGNGYAGTSGYGFTTEALANRAPTAADVSVSTAEDTVLAASLPAGTDPDGDTFVYSTVTGPAHGTLTVAGTGAYTYTPTADFNGADTFTYRISDPYGAGNVYTVGITVTPVNDRPVAQSATVSATEDMPISGTLRATDVEGDPLVFSVAAAPGHGSLALDAASGAFIYTPARDFNGADRFDFTVSDGRGGTDTRTVTLNVAAINDAPVAADATGATAEDTARMASLPPATDADGDAVEYAVATAPQHGTLTLANTGLYTYTPAPDFNGADGFTYRVSDGRGGASVHAVTLTVTPVNDPPVAEAGTVSGAEDTPLAGVLRASDVDGDLLAFALATGPAHGSLTLDAASGALTYTPAHDFNGADRFEFTADDGRGGIDTRTVTLNVAAVNDAPAAQTATMSGSEDTPITDVLHASDVDGDPLVFSVATAPAHGSLALDAASGAFTYTPARDFSGADRFDFTASDGRGGTDTRTVTLNLTALNDPPVAADARAETAEDTALASTLPVATDAEGDPIDYAVATGPAHGTLTVGNTGRYTYTPAPDFSGADGFTYRVSDGRGGASVHAVTLTVTPVNDPPVAEAGTVSGTEDTPIAGTLRAGDVDGDALVFSVATAPAHGSLALDAASGAFTFTPARDFNGADRFDFTVSDGHGGYDTRTVTLNLAPVNDAPVAADARAMIAEDSALASALPPATDAEGDPIDYAVATAPAHGTLILANAGNYTYTPAPDFNGADGFTYRVSDGHGDTTIHAVTLTVTPVNDAPVAADAQVRTDEDAPLSGTLPPASDVDDEELRYERATGPLHGRVTIDVDGSFIYTPDRDYHGVDGFDYRVVDSAGASSTWSVLLSVAPVNDAPEGAPAIEGAPVQGQMLRAVGMPVDADGLGPLAYQWLADGQPIVGADRQTFVPGQAEVGRTIRVAATYRDQGGTLEHVVSGFTDPVANVNDAPVTRGTLPAATSNVGVPLALFVPFETFSDLDGDALALSARMADGAPLPDWLAFSPGTRTFSGTPAVADAGQLALVVIASDGEFSATAPLSLTLTDLEGRHIDGRVLDGYVSGAAVHIDRNGNGLPEQDEATGMLTDALGRFAGQVYSQGPLIATGGMNADTSLPNALMLMAPAGASVVNPMTTLIQAIVSRHALDGVAAEEQVVAALGLPAGLDLLHYDPLSQPAGDPTALQVQRAIARIAMTASLAGDGQAVFAAMADMVADDATAIDLGDGATLARLLAGTPVPQATMAWIIAADAALLGCASLEAIAETQLQYAPHFRDWNPAADRTVELAAALLGDAPGIVIAPDSFALQFGQFTDPETGATRTSLGLLGGERDTLGIARGLILSTGDASPSRAHDAERAGFALAAPAGIGALSDPLLQNAAASYPGSVEVVDATSVEFRFIVTDASVAWVRLDLAFASDEVAPDTPGALADLAGIFVNDTNFALLPTASDGLLSMTTAALAFGAFVDNRDGHVAIDFDRVTAPLTMFAPVRIGINTLRIAVGDTRDGRVDSALFVFNLQATGYGGAGLVQRVGGTADDDRLAGSPLDDFLDGGNGDDRIDGDAGRDLIDGGAGNDMLNGGPGDDRLYGGPGRDAAGYAGHREDYAVSLDDDGAVRVVTLTDGIEGDDLGDVDLLRDIESIVFGERSYRVAVLLDKTAPEVTLDDALPEVVNRIAGTLELTLRFGEEIFGLDDSDFSVVNGTVLGLSGEGAHWIVRVAPTAGIAGERFAVTLKGGAVSDEAGNENASTLLAERPIDTLAPAVAAFSPTASARNVGVDSRIVLTFSEPVLPGIGSVALTTADGVLVQAFDPADGKGLSFAGNTLTLTPDGTLAHDTTYLVALPTGAVLDSAGNPAEGIVGYGFSTTPLPSLAIQASVPAVSEGNRTGGSVVFTIARSGDAGGAASVDWHVASDAASPADFEGNRLASGTVHFAPGETARTVAIGIAGDTTIEPDERFTVALSNVSNATLSVGVATVTIVNDDHPPGTAGDDVLIGGAGDDGLLGLAGNDTLEGLAGNDTLDGGDGLDTLRVHAARAVAVIDVAPSGATLAAPGLGVDLLLAVERIRFDDRSVALDINATGNVDDPLTKGIGGNAGKAFRLYRAAFDRTPDPEGLGYWIGQVDAGARLFDLASGFIDSTEFRTLYGAAPSNQEFTRALYRNVLHREPDAAGYTYWNALLSGAPVDGLYYGATTRQQMLVDFSEAAENHAATIGLIGDGIEFIPWP